MKFEPKISGTKVTDFNITPIFRDQFVWMSEIMEKIQRQDTLDFILDTYRFYKGQEEKRNDLVTILDYDTILKISIMEHYPQYEQELKEYFGDDWFKYYIRFNH
jgi:hypothetical protein